jgi:molecular chaperone IbpA
MTTPGFYRMSDFIGAERIRNLLLETSGISKQNYPPYNIIKYDDDDTYAIEIAVAGLKAESLKIELANSVLTVSCSIPDKPSPNYLYKGVAERNFERKFVLADTIKVTGADIADGMLRISLENVIPEHMKPRNITINTRTNITQQKEQQLILEN